ncbi:MAG: hypothetical protein METHAR1v1_850002 [Methanothrix sp.]|nr:MAG: hypothetical protein METHAR1v1_850002 [Methanothrix sp.]
MYTNVHIDRLIHGDAMQSPLVAGFLAGGDLHSRPKKWHHIGAILRDKKTGRAESLPKCLFSTPWTGI